ncbi:hypothetical protein [Marinisporobacter balticus]|uniref:Uncharacterized protein n=1 Tax=Marinisporobacter balticus TaxID=2018667 RepID=A0A4R2KA52_9FIRM|nr:hypothetical protein [Marinisporobacter balticus]TCO68867.1 hypothetical protein EV214_13810 [Marinisporobacter balticus]
MPNDKLEKFLEWMRLFFQGATDFGRKSRNILEKEYSDEMDNFMLICFADTLGIPLPISYYTLELLPYLAEDMEMWEKRMLNRKSIWGEKWGEYDLDA